MKPFHYRGDRMVVEETPLADIAEAVGTPVYVYSHRAIEARFDAFAQALGPDTLTCFAAKANGNLAVLSLLARRGAGFDIVSGGELARVLKAGGEGAKVVFSGVGKSAQEIRSALEAGIFCFNVESEPELRRIDAIAGALGKRAPVALRVNPDVDPRTHPYIATGLSESKFGVPMGQAPHLYAQAARMPHVEIRGIACHIGSQLLDLSPLREAAGRVRALYETLRGLGMAVGHIDMGGGVGIAYREDERAPTPDAYAAALREPLAGLPVRLVVELGRALVGGAGALLTRVEYLKTGENKRFCIVDGAMNDLMRPALYKAWHEILPVRRRTGPAEIYDVVGPVCETGDFLGLGRELTVAEGDLLAVLDAGAYGFVMSSNYNTRPRAPEVLVEGDRFRVIRRRESLDDLLDLEVTT